MLLPEIFEHLLIVVIGSLVGSCIFTLVFIFILKHSIISSATKLVSREAKEKATTWLQESIKNGIGDALKDTKVKMVILEILELVKAKLLKEEDESKK
jgi:hypothetical protein